MTHPRIETALRRIASGRVPVSGGKFAPLSRHEMIELARMACMDYGLRFGAADAWIGAPRRARTVAIGKIRLRRADVPALAVRA
jgi:hypothetical protein